MERARALPRDLALALELILASKLARVAACLVAWGRQRLESCPPDWNF